MTEASLLQQIDNAGVATLTLNRPEIHNAFDEVLIRELSASLAALDMQENVRVVVLAAAGESFSAGADLNWMKRMASYSEAENRKDAGTLARLMYTLSHLRKPTIARVQGNAFGGGVGLIAACDIAVVAEAAQFALSEARLGLIPAVISPYVIAAMGERAARRYFLTGERFSANQALKYGLAHEIAPFDQLDNKVEKIIHSLLECGPSAQAASKVLIQRIKRGGDDEAVMEYTVERIAKVRASAEGQEGISAFLEKRAPKWLAKKG
ncbi:MAG: enoyl-CoA hydratase/isomerase family protein [Dongiaceae bacterium]